jgi:hypothetical protein
VSDAVWGFVGVIVGAISSTGGSVWIQSKQAKDALEAERRERERSASSTAVDSTIRLLRLPAEPQIGEASSSAQYDSWREMRDDLVVAFDAAVEDLRDSDLRARLKRASILFTQADVAGQMTGRSEHLGRTVACRHILACLGAFRREEKLPDEPQQLIELIQAVDDWWSMQDD